jgi:hypothetical protein
MSLEPPPADRGVPMLPVEILPAPPSEEPGPTAEPRPRARSSGAIEITFGYGTRVCLRGEVAPTNQIKWKPRNAGSASSCASSASCASGSAWPISLITSLGWLGFRRKQPRA